MQNLYSGPLLIIIFGGVGYLFIIRTYRTRYDVLYKSGYHIFFRSIIAGSILFAVAHLIAVYLINKIPSLDTLWHPYITSDYFAKALLSLGLGYFLPFVINLFYSKKKAARYVAQENGDLIELIMAESLDSAKLVELSMKSGKSYIGFVLESGVAKHEADISLLPIASGFRNKEHTGTRDYD